MGVRVEPGYVLHEEMVGNVVMGSEAEVVSLVVVVMVVSDVGSLVGSEVGVELGSDVGVGVEVGSEVGVSLLLLPPASTAAQNFWTAGRTSLTAVSAPQALRTQGVAAAVRLSMLSPIICVSYRHSF